MSSNWNPIQYEKFKAQRSKPFFDLLNLVEASHFRKAADLGCGTGELTRELFRRLKPLELLGVDSSAEMLKKSEAFTEEGLRFELQDIGAYQPKEKFDLVFSNAALQWLPDHESLIPRVLSWVSPGGQAAIQMPAAHDHPSHAVADAVARRLFPEIFPKSQALHSVLPLARYAEIFQSGGFSRHVCRMEVYGVDMPSTLDVVEWTKGTRLTFFQDKLSGADFKRFLETYTTELISQIGTGPYFYAFTRILLWGKKNS